MAVWANEGSTLLTTLRVPLMRPQAMKPGMSGMKMLAMRLKSSLMGVAFFARIFACRALPSPISALAAA